MILNLGAYFKLSTTLTRFFIYLLFFLIIGVYDLWATAEVSLRSSAMLALATCAGMFLLCMAVLRSLPGYISLNPINFFISASIMFLLIHPTESPLWFASALAIAAASKLIRYRSQPVINPAAAGLLGIHVLSSLLTQAGVVSFPVLISWWGADMIQGFAGTELLFVYGIAIAFLAGFAYFTLSFRRLTYSTTFFMTCACLIMIESLRTTQSSIAAFEFIVSSLFSSFAFLTLVMIPEPKTSPVFPRQQILTAILGGVFFYVVFAGHIPFLDQGMAFLYTIVVMNAITLLTKFAPMRHA